MSELIVWLQDVVFPAFLSLARRFCPLPRFGHYVIVTRFDDVQEVMHRWQDFPVPYGAKAKNLKWSPEFLLGMKGDRNGPYAKQRADVEALWRRDDLSRVQEIADRITRGALCEHAETQCAKNNAGNKGKSKKPPFDAMQKIIVASAVGVVEEYYGFRIEDEDEPAFVSAAYAVAGYLFGLSNPRKAAPKKATEAIEAIFRVIDRSIQVIGRCIAEGSAVPDSIIARALKKGICPRDLRSWLMGMTVGFIPAHTNAAGRALDVLLDNPVGHDAMQAAANAGRDDALLTLCYEALRFRYILPWLWREANGTPTINEGTERPFQFRRGDILYVSPLSAMRDRNRVLNPDIFMPDRPNDLYLVYGYLMHNCVGRGIADTLLKANFRPLFARGVARHRRTRWQGSIPVQIEVVIGPGAGAGQRTRTAQLATHR